MTIIRPLLAAASLALLLAACDKTDKGPKPTLETGSSLPETRASMPPINTAAPTSAGQADVKVIKGGTGSPITSGSVK